MAKSGTFKFLFITTHHFSYNKTHARTRVVIERAFGVLKRRFSILQALILNFYRNNIVILKGVVRLPRDFVPTVIVACMVLHNLAIDFNQPEPDDDEIECPPDGDVDADIAEEQAGICGRNAGQAKRKKITEQFFSV